MKHYYSRFNGLLKARERHDFEQWAEDEDGGISQWCIQGLMGMFEGQVEASKSQVEMWEEGERFVGFVGGADFEYVAGGW